jgi:phosphoribosylglycinamide formyltransferase-1
MKIALFISGGGTTMAAIISATQNGTLKNVTPSLIIASREDAGGIEKSRHLGIPDEDIVIINPKNFKTKEEFGETILRECQKRGINFIGQYGWLAMTPPNVINAYKDMIVNQHPGPLDTCPNTSISGGQAGRPDFGGVGMYGMRVHQARLSFVKEVNRDFWTEATAHRVTAQFDEGVVLKRIRVPILENDTAGSLQARVLPVEHQVQIELLKDFSEGTVEEFHREVPLVLPGEESILDECKQLAIKLYPNG